jgi:hypothetical protein
VARLPAATYYLAAEGDQHLVIVHRREVAGASGDCPLPDLGKRFPPPALPGRPLPAAALQIVCGGDDTMPTAPAEDSWRAAVAACCEPRCERSQIRGCPRPVAATDRAVASLAMPGAPGH